MSKLPGNPLNPEVLPLHLPAKAMMRRHQTYVWVAALWNGLQGPGTWHPNQINDVRERDVEASELHLGLVLR